MKKWGSVKILFTCVFVFFISINAYTHSPKDAQAHYLESEKKLTVIVNHPVINEKRHYVKEINILKSGQHIASKKFGNQLTRTNQAYYFTINNIKNGDEITIEAYCSINGKLEKKVKVKSNEQKESTSSYSKRY
jgi:desulfoferrodoxin (superoxide reductase-like protein)